MLIWGVLIIIFRTAIILISLIARHLSDYCSICIAIGIQIALMFGMVSTISKGSRMIKGDEASMTITDAATTLIIIAGFFAAAGIILAAAQLIITIYWRIRG